MTEQKVKYLIVGAGPCGLGAAYRLQDLSEDDFLIVEKNDWVGGLAASFVDDEGFTWDIGGHVQFSHYEYFDKVMDRALGSDGWLNHERESWVWIKDRFVPYPFQNNIRYLPRETMWNCLEGLVELSSRAEPKTPRDFKEWILAIFGKGIADEFMLPYNFKVWAYPPEEMAYDWIGERVSVIDLKRVIKNVVFETDDVSWGPNNTFRFPKHGGTGAIWRSVAGLIGDNKIKLNAEVEKIDAADKRVTLSDGTQVVYEQLLSTMPLDCAAQLVTDLPSKLKRRASELLYSSSNIVGVGLEGKAHEELTTKCWMYFPEDNCPFYRVTLFSRYSPNNVPDISRYFSLMTETSESARKPVDQATIVEESVQGLVNTKLIESVDQVVSTWLFRAPHGYPIPSVERDAILHDVIPELEKHEIYPRGRFGGWKYEVGNQDHTFMQGVEWTDLMLQNKQEETFRL